MKHYKDSMNLENFEFNKDVILTDKEITSTIELDVERERKNMVLVTDDEIEENIILLSKGLPLTRTLTALGSKFKIKAKKVLMSPELLRTCRNKDCDIKFVVTNKRKKYCCDNCYIETRREENKLAMREYNNNRSPELKEKQKIYMRLYRLEKAEKARKALTVDKNTKDEQDINFPIKVHQDCSITQKTLSEEKEQ